VLHTAPGSDRGGHFSKGLGGYNIGNVQQFLNVFIVEEQYNLLSSPLRGFFQSLMIS
jgi:hypothetical protein